MINCRYPELDLDLTFKPVANENPQAFSREQIEHYNETGYLTEVTLFEGERLNSLARRFTEEAEECAKLNPHIKLSWVYNLVKDPALLLYIQDLMGSSIICHISRMIDKEPGSRYQFPGHQDCTFNAMDARCVVVWMALEDASSKMAACGLCQVLINSAPWKWWIPKGISTLPTNYRIRQ